MIHDYFVRLCERVYVQGICFGFSQFSVTAFYLCIKTTFLQKYKFRVFVCRLGTLQSYSK